MGCSYYKRQQLLIVSLEKGVMKLFCHYFNIKNIDNSRFLTKLYQDNFKYINSKISYIVQKRSAIYGISLYYISSIYYL